jgi:hypothetical protein
MSLEGLKEMSTSLGFEVPNWEQIYEMLLKIAEKVKADSFNPDIIVGVCRGGWPPARVISDLLDNPELANVKAEFYLGVGETKGEPVITQPVSTSVRGKKILIVDEVADTGKSLRLVKEHLMERGALEVKIAVIYYKPWSLIIPDYYEKETPLWVVFPWEIRETVKKLMEKCEREGRSFEEEKRKLVEAGLNPRLIERFEREISGEFKS